MTKKEMNMTKNELMEHLTKRLERQVLGILSEEEKVQKEYDEVLRSVAIKTMMKYVVYHGVRYDTKEAEAEKDLALLKNLKLNILKAFMFTGVHYQEIADIHNSLIRAFSNRIELKGEQDDTSQRSEEAKTDKERC